MLSCYNLSFLLQALLPPIISSACIPLSASPVYWLLGCGCAGLSKNVRLTLSCSFGNQFLLPSHPQLKFYSP
jgi:hypothetical protein